MTYYLRILHVDQNNAEQVIKYREFDVAMRVLERAIMYAIDNHQGNVTAFTHEDCIRSYTIHDNGVHIKTYTLCEEDD